MHKITTIFWDVDNTLLDFDYSQEHALTKCFRTLGREITEDEIRLYTRINDDYWKRLELGQVTKAQLLTGRFVTLFQKLGMTEVPLESVLREYQTTLGSVFRFLDDSLTICRNLRGHVKQYAVTNGVTQSQRNKLSISGLSEVLDGIFISEEIGSPKPQPQFFNYCLEHIDEKDKSKILIVGDSLSSDIKGGLQAGILTCWYQPALKNAAKNCGAGLGDTNGKVLFQNNVDAQNNGDFQASDGNRMRESNGRPLDGVLENSGKEKAEQAADKPDYVIHDLHMLYEIVGSAEDFL